MFVKAEIQGIRVRGVVRLPRTALREGDIVFAVDGESHLRFRKVDVLRRERDVVLVRAGLAEGERICVSPLEEAVDGMGVEIVGSAPDIDLDPVVEGGA